MKVLCIATHPDDETLGPGGTLLRHAADGDEVFWMIVTEAKAEDFGETLVASRPATIRRINEQYVFAGVVDLGFPAARLSDIVEKDIIERLTKEIGAIKPDILYLNHGGDVHSDHRAAFDAVMAAVKPFKAGKTIRRILAYETPSETEQAPVTSERPFLPNSFVDITPFLERKIAIFNLYEGEGQPHPLPREASAIAALARWRGATFGVEAAEAFMLIRELR